LQPRRRSPLCLGFPRDNMARSCPSRTPQFHALAKIRAQPVKRPAFVELLFHSAITGKPGGSRAAPAAGTRKLIENERDSTSRRSIRVASRPPERCCCCSGGAFSVLRLCGHARRPPAARSVRWHSFPAPVAGPEAGGPSPGTKLKGGRLELLTAYSTSSTRLEMPSLSKI